MPSTEAAFYDQVPPTLVDTGTARIAYRRFGTGEPIVFIHGWPLSGFTWRKLLPSLAAHHTCITVDLAGAGESEWDSDNDFSFHGHAEHIRKLLAAIDLGPYRLVAHDTGATVARRLAIIDRERARHLVCIDTEIPNHRPPLIPLFQKVLAVPGSAWAFRQLLRSPRFLRSSSGFGGCFVDKTLIEGEFTERFVKPLVDSAARMDGQIRYARGIDWQQLDGLAEGHREIKAPVLLIWGDRDPFFPIDRARTMANDFPDGRGLITIERAKLFPHEEHPALVLRHIEEFFRE
jgi:haloalkane dehalogenase